MAGQLTSGAVIVLAAGLCLHCRESKPRLRLSAEQVAEAWLGRTCDIYDRGEPDEDLEELVKKYGSRVTLIFKAKLDRGPSEADRESVRGLASEDFSEIQDPLYQERIRRALGRERLTQLQQEPIKDFVARAERDYVKGWTSAALTGLVLSGDSGKALVLKLSEDENSPHREEARGALTLLK